MLEMVAPSNDLVVSVCCTTCFVWNWKELCNAMRVGVICGIDRGLQVASSLSITSMSPFN